MKKQQNHKHYLKSLVEYMKPLAAESHYFKNFKLSQQHQGIKGGKKMKLFEKFTLQRPDHIGYSSLALSKISKSTLAGCNNKGVHSPHRAFFVRYLSMPMHILYASCGGRTSSDVLVTFITSLLTDPHGLRQSFSSEVQAFNQNKGAHTHA